MYLFECITLNHRAISQSLPDISPDLSSLATRVFDVTVSCNTLNLDLYLLQDFYTYAPGKCPSGCFYINNSYIDREEEALKKKNKDSFQSSS